MREMGKLFLTAIVIAAAGVTPRRRHKNPRTIDRRCISRHARRPSDTNTGASNRAHATCGWFASWIAAGDICRGSGDARFGAPRR